MLGGRGPTDIIIALAIGRPSLLSEDIDIIDSTIDKKKTTTAYEFLRSLNLRDVRARHNAVSVAKNSNGLYDVGVTFRKLIWNIGILSKHPAVAEDDIHCWRAPCIFDFSHDCFPGSYGQRLGRHNPTDYPGSVRQLHAFPKILIGLLCCLPLALGVAGIPDENKEPNPANNQRKSIKPIATVRRNRIYDVVVLHPWALVSFVIGYSLVILGLAIGIFGGFAPLMRALIAIFIVIVGCEICFAAQDRWDD